MEGLLPYRDLLRALCDENPTNHAKCDQGHRENPRIPHHCVSSSRSNPRKAPTFLGSKKLDRGASQSHGEGIRGRRPARRCSFAATNTAARPASVTKRPMVSVSSSPIDAPSRSLGAFGFATRLLPNSLGRHWISGDERRAGEGGFPNVSALKGTSRY